MNEEMNFLVRFLQMNEGGEAYRKSAAMQLVMFGWAWKAIRKNREGGEWKTI